MTFVVLCSAVSPSLGKAPHLVNVCQNTYYYKCISHEYVMLYLALSGCKGAQVEEIWSMEPENFDNLKYVHICSFIILHAPSLINTGLFKLTLCVLFQTSSWVDFPVQVAARRGASRINRSGFKA